MFPFDVILFDVGGVLLTNGWDHRERAAVLDQFHLDRAEFEARHATQNDPWERDAIPVKEYLEATVFYVPRSFSQDDFLGAICAQSQLLEDGALGILGELAASDKCMLGVLNNEARATTTIALSVSVFVGIFKLHSVRAMWDCANRAKRSTSGHWIFSGSRRNVCCSSTIAKRIRLRQKLWG
jgi:hypothetical protein